MNYTLRINQKIIIDNKHDIDIIDAAILDTMKGMSGATGITKLVDNNTDYYWMAHQKLVDELPILRIKKDSMYRRIKKLINKGYINPHPKNKALRATYYRITLLTESIFSSNGLKSVVSENNPIGIGFKSERVSDESPKDNSTIDKQTKRALEIIALIEKANSTIQEFCRLNPPQLERMKNTALFKGDASEHIKPFVEHNIDNLLLRSEPISFFVKKFTQWLRYAKSFNRGKGRKAPNSYTKIMDEYYIPEIREKIRVRQPERFKAYEKEFNDVVVRAEIETTLKGLKGVKNKTYTPYLIFDVCYGMLAAKAGTKPERRFSKFRQWYNKLSDYKKNQANLREEFKNFINQ